MQYMGQCNALPISGAFFYRNRPSGRVSCDFYLAIFDAWSLSIPLFHIPVVFSASDMCSIWYVPSLYTVPTCSRDSCVYYVYIMCNKRLWLACERHAALCDLFWLVDFLYVGVYTMLRLLPLSRAVTGSCFLFLSVVASCFICIGRTFLQ